MPLCCTSDEVLAKGTIKKHIFHLLKVQMHLLPVGSWDYYSNVIFCVLLSEFMTIKV